MKKQVIYLKEVGDIDEIFKKNNNKMPMLFKRLILLYKNIFNKITKRIVDEKKIWILPIIEIHNITKTKKLLRKINSQENIYILSNELSNDKIYKIMDEYKIEYLTLEKIKKSLLKHIISYISNIQKLEASNLELTILVNNNSELHIDIIEQLSKIVRNVKIVSLNIYKFRKLEEQLYNEYGIAIQFSNSYRKSLKKSRLIINLDFNELEINEYEICDSAIIINCMKQNIRIKSRLFNGININSCEISFKKEIVEEFKKRSLYKAYKKILLYASLIVNETNLIKIQDKLNQDNVNIIDLIGNNGIIGKKEFKNITKKLDKKIKKE